MSPHNCLGHDNAYLSQVRIGHMTRHLPATTPTYDQTPTPIPDLPRHMADQVAQLREAGKAANTRRAYLSDWARFTNWCDTHGLCPLPAHPDTVSAYLADQVEIVKVSTLRRHVATIAKAHQVAGLPDPCKTAALADTLAGLRRTHGTPRDEAPGLLAHDLRHTLDTLGDSLSDLRDRAILLVGWCAGLRRSEIANLTWGDLQPDPGGLVLVLRNTKTDKTGTGRAVGLARETVPALCPVTALATWRDALGAIAGIDTTADHAPLFVQVNRHGTPGAALSGQAIAQIVQRRTQQAGLPVRYRGHSLRKGLVQSATLAGVQDSAIMQTTGHRSVVMLRQYQAQAGLVSHAAHRGLLV
jgi:integrase